MKKKKLLIGFAVILVLSLASMGFGAEVSLRWDSVDGATGYRIQQSIDVGATWSTPAVDVGNVLTYTLSDVPDSGLVLFRVSAYNNHGEVINTYAGAWYNGDWKPPNNPMGLGIQ